MEGLLAAVGEAIKRIVQEYGPLMGVAVLLFLFYHYVIYWLIRQLLGAKDKEIERLVTERNKLQELILKKRRSSLETSTEKDLPEKEKESKK